MRRGRDLRDHRDALRRKAALARKRQRKKQNQKVIERNTRLSERGVQRASVVARAKREMALEFKTFDDYKYTFAEPLRICHVIDSLGMGGGQTMLLELANSLEKYYPDNVVKNDIICARSVHHAYDQVLFTSYGQNPLLMREKDFRRRILQENYNIILHHRLAISTCIRHMLPNNGIKYVLLNHTYHQLQKVSSFIRCDFYISVCNYLFRRTKWSSVIHPSRCIVILNGVENDYIDSIEPFDLDGSFKTGRCHRLVSSKFKPDSLNWMDNVVLPEIPGYKHYILGHHTESKRICKKSKSCKYFGSILNRQKKMSIIKGFDAYFYETFQQEGASMAILESLACGVPVLCMKFGGNSELVTEGVNGYIVSNREQFLEKMKYLSNPENLAKMKASTLEDFNNRLHVKYIACKYMQVFENLLGLSK